MKKFLIASLVAMAPALASAQVTMISGFNFGQFVGFGYPATDGVNFDPVGSVASNYGPNNQPGITDSGVYHVNNSIAIPYSAGSSALYFNGTNGSSAWDFATGSNVSVVELNANQPINHNTVNPLINMFGGDDNNARLRFTSSAGTNQFSIVTNTTGFLDFDPVAFSQPNDYNFTFAAYAASGGSGTVSFSLNGNSLGSFNITAAESAFNLDLDASFYGQSAATLVATVSGDIVFDNIQVNGVIPEPSTYAAILGALSLGFVMIRRRFQAKAA